MTRRTWTSIEIRTARPIACGSSDDRRTGRERIGRVTALKGRKATADEALAYLIVSLPGGARRATIERKYLFVSGFRRKLVTNCAV
jgi:hypothetical protein